MNQAEQSSGRGPATAWTQELRPTNSQLAESGSLQRGNPTSSRIELRVLRGGLSLADVGGAGTGVTSLPRWVRFFVGLLTLSALIAGIAFLMRPSTVAIRPTEPRPPTEELRGLLPDSVTKPRLTFLVLGVDSLTGRGRSDTIFLVHLMVDSQKIRALSVPRDTYAMIERPKKNVRDKINHAYAWGGAELIKKTVENVMGLTVDHYVVIDYSLFRRIVDFIGGVPLDVEKRMYYIDNAGGLKVDLQPGMQTLNGDQGLQYVRFRFDRLGDTGRILRQQRFVGAALKRLKEPGVLLHLAYKMPALLEYVTTDMPTTLALKLLWNLRSFEPEDLDVMTLPGSGRNVASKMYGKNIYYFFPDEVDLEGVRDHWFFEPEPTFKRGEGSRKKKLDPPEVKASHLNPGASSSSSLSAHTTASSGSAAHAPPGTGDPESSPSSHGAVAKASTPAPSLSPSAATAARESMAPTVPLTPDPSPASLAGPDSSDVSTPSPSGGTGELDPGLPFSDLVGPDASEVSGDNGEADHLYGAPGTYYDDEGYDDEAYQDSLGTEGH